MTTKDITHGKIERGEMEIELIWGNFISSWLLNILFILKLKVPGFTHLVVHQNN